MLDALVNIATGAAVLFLLLAGWIAVQHWARKADQLPPDCDMLHRPEKGCHHCQMQGKCEMGQKQRDDNGG